MDNQRFKKRAIELEITNEEQENQIRYLQQQNEELQSGLEKLKEEMIMKKTEVEPQL